MAQTIEYQINRFIKGFPKVKLNRPAKVNDGIIRCSAEEVKVRIRRFEQMEQSLDVLKFVPASGAATRMFKDLFSAISEIEEGKAINNSAQKFLDNLQEFVFYEELLTAVSNEIEGNLDVSDPTHQLVCLKTLLISSAFNFGSKPKATIPFHWHASGAETPILDHMIEGVSYAMVNKTVKIHFTISEEHQSLFEEIIKRYKAHFDSVDFEISYSYQAKSTDTFAVDLNNMPVINNGSFLMRPSGHGALIENLNQLSTEMVFIKNIDNVCKPSLEKESSDYKKLLGDVLIEQRNQIFDLLHKIENNELDKAKAYCFNTFGIALESKSELLDLLNRPIRVCGMVKNMGEPGGGPFWVENKDGFSSLQIVEKAQIDTDDEKQLQILNDSTHFNPVDLVCWLKDYKGNAFDLLHYRDDETGFITEKTFEGKAIKALELPGLWNGAMAGWLTFFVEVPLETFNPVKTVLDLLKPGHYSSKS